MITCEKMDTTKPTISVLMPVYNGEKYIDEAIQSILNQTYEDFEFIIINDCSTDKTEKKILKYKDPRIKYFTNEVNLGVTKTLNKGLQYCKGKYIARMDADDISMIHRLEEQIKEIKYYHYDIVGANIIIIDENTNQIGLREYDEFVNNTIKIKSPLAHPTVMFKKSLLKQREYNEELKAAQDYELWLYLYSKSKQFKNIQKYLLKYRQHRNTIKNNNTKQTIRDTIKAKEIAQQKYGLMFNTKEKIRLKAEKLLLLLPSNIILKLFYLIEGVKK